MGAGAPLLSRVAKPGRWIDSDGQRLTASTASCNCLASHHRPHRPGLYRRPSLDNVGTLKAHNNLSATAGNDLVNSGLIQAGNRLDLLAGNSVVNKAGGIIAGRDVSVHLNACQAVTAKG